MISSRILPVFALLVAAGIFFIYVGPTWSGPLAEIKSAIETKEKALAAADAYTKQQNALIAARNDIDPEDLTRIAAFLPDSVDNVGLILDLNALAARSGLSLSNIDVTTSSVATPAGRSAAGALPSKNTSMTSSIDLSLSAVGTYSALQTFLSGVEKSARLLDVRDIQVKGSDTGVYTFQMKLRLFWLR